MRGEKEESNEMDEVFILNGMEERKYQMGYPTQMGSRDSFTLK